MSYVSLAKYTLKDDPGFGQSWQLPSSVTASIDWTPPALDGVVDNNPLTNHAICLSDVPLDSNDCYYQFGQGDVTEMSVDSVGRDALHTVAGYRPQANTMADCVAEHLLRSPGQERVNPLTCGLTRGLEVHLGGRIWDHTLTGLTDPLALPVLQIEAEGLAKIFREQGETQYRLAMGGLRKKYDTRPVKELIQYLFPVGRDDLPLLAELTPTTTATETWPTNGAVTSGQDNAWSVVHGSASVTSGVLYHTSGGVAPGYCGLLLGTTFSGNDRECTTVVKYTSSRSAGLYTRSDATLENAYIIATGWTTYNAGEIWKNVSDVPTRLAFGTGTFALDDILLGSSIGSTHICKENGATLISLTDTAVPSGGRSGIRTVSGTAAARAILGQSGFDDLISGGGGGNSFLNLLLTGVG